MFDHADTTADAPKATDSNLAQNALINQVRDERQAGTAYKPEQNKGNDTATSLFGALTLVGDDLAALFHKSGTDTAAVPAQAGSDVPPQSGTDAKGSAGKGDSAQAPKGDTPAQAPKAGEYPLDQPAKVLDQAALDKIHADKGVEKEKAKLEDQINKLEKEHPEQKQQLEQMKQNMEAFEHRAASQKPPLSPEEVKKFYGEVNHMLEVKDGPNVPVKMEDRMAVAEQVMLHASNPSTIDQGDHSTCNVTTVESRMFARNPAAAAHLIGEVATTGHYTTTDASGKQVTVAVDKDGLAKHKNTHGNIEEANNPPKDGDRSYASQIFQVTAVNVAHQTNEMRVMDGDKVFATYPAGTVEYRQGDAQPNAKPPNSGEVLYDKRTNQPIKDANGDVIHAPNLGDDAIANVYNKISTAPESGIYITNKDDVYGCDGKQVTQIGSEAELQAKIAEAKQAGKLPIILAVNSGQEPFYSDSQGGAAGGAGGGHVVTVTDYDAKTGAVQIDNQWGSQSKHSVDMHELYIATMKPKDAVVTLEKDCAKDAKDGHVDYAKELELLRLKHNLDDKDANKVSDSEYDKQLVYLTKQAVKDAEDHHGGKLDQRTETELSEQLWAIRGKEGTSARWKAMEGQVWETVANAIFTKHGQLTDGDGAPIKIGDNYATNMESAVNQLHDGGNQWFYYKQGDYDNMAAALKGKSPAQLQEMDQEFQAKYGKTMEAYINDSLKRHPEQRDRMLAILHQEQGQAA